MIRRILIATLLGSLSACGGSTPTAPPANVPYSSTDLRVGDGTTAITGSIVQVNYTGWLYSASQPDNKGNQFDANPAFSFVLGAGQVIRGWDLGVPGMKVGGVRRLVIPPDLAYGAQSPNSKIPGNSTLVFDIELLSVQ